MKLHINDVLGRAAERGLAPESIEPCLINDLGNGWYEVAIHSPAYPRGAKAQSAPRRVGGPGTELKALLAWIGIKSSPTCSCNAKALQMDRNGCAWCEANVATIVSWLQEEHERQKLLVPFIRLAAEQLVRLSIRKARKKGTCK